MRMTLCAALGANLTLGALGLTATAAAAGPTAPTRTALSVQTYGRQASYRGPALNVGYSAKARRMTACLASYPGVYDPKTDLIHVRHGVTRRCTL